LQMWAEARDLWYVAGVCWAEAERLALDYHAEFEAWDDSTATVAEWLASEENAQFMSCGYWRGADIRKYALHLDDNRTMQMRVNKIMKRLGYRQVRKEINGVTERLWSLIS
jgi:hypothetical protein